MTAVTLIGANGDLIDTSVPPFTLGPGQGLFGPPPVDAPSVAAVGILAGSLEGNARWLDRPLRLNLSIVAGTHQGLLEAIQRLSAAVAPVVPGTVLGRSCRLVVTRPDGTSRTISARYTAGLPALELPVVTATAVEVALVFRAADPTWATVGTVDAVVSFPVTGSGASATPFDSPSLAFDAAGHPFDGFQSTEAEGTAAVVLANLGDVEAWPVWELTGQATSVEVVNRSTGQRWRWAGTLPSGARLEVVTDDRRPSVRVGGVNAYGGTATGSRLWPLAPGANDVVFIVGGADTNTSLTATWAARQLTL